MRITLPRCRMTAAFVAPRCRMTAAFVAPNSRATAAFVALCCGLAWMGWACGDESTTPQREAVPDFALEDTNPHSASSGQTVALSQFPNTIVMIFFGEEDCSVCQAQVERMDDAIAQLAGESITQVKALMINQHGPNGRPPDVAALYLTAWNTTAPVLHDTTAAGGYDAVGRLLGCENFNDFLITDRRHRVWRKTQVSETGEFDLRTEAGYTTLLGWIRQIHAE